VLVVEPSLMEHGYTAVRARAYFQELKARLRDIPGVEDLSVTSTPPLSGLRITAPLQLDGRTVDVYIHQVDQHYLTTMKIRLLRGRNLIDGDERSVVVSESLAQRKWPNGDALGEIITIGDDALTVVGIAGNARSLAMRDPDAVELYRLAREADLTGLFIVARTSVPSADVAAACSMVARNVDSNLTPQVQLLKTQFEASVRDMEIGALAVSLLGVTALAVACLGVVGLVAYSVAARTKEIGIRLALGAESRHIVKSLTRQFWAPSSAVSRWASSAPPASRSSCGGSYTA
jgi:hypothetical protein